MKLRKLIKYHEARDVVALIDHLFLYVYKDNLYYDLDRHTKEHVDTILSYKKKINEMLPEEINMLWRSAGFLLKKLSGESASEVVEEVRNQETMPKCLQGNYWVIPHQKGFIECGDFLHYAIANETCFTEGLGINSWDFKRALHSGGHALLPFILQNGGIMAKFTTEGNNRVGHFQTCQKSLPWLKKKIYTLASKKCIVRVIDPNKPYRGFDSGIKFILKK
jgi:hypothetical protein